MGNEICAGREVKNNFLEPVAKDLNLFRDNISMCESFLSKNTNRSKFSSFMDESYDSLITDTTNLQKNESKNIIISPLKNIPSHFSLESISSIFMSYSNYITNDSGEYLVGLFIIEEKGILFNNKKILLLSNEAFYLCEEDLKMVLKRFPWHNLRKVYQIKSIEKIIIIGYNAKYFGNLMLKDENNLKFFLEIETPEYIKVIINN